MDMRRLSLLAAVAVAAGLRVWRLGGQILEDDEFHGLQASVYLDAAALLARRTPHGFALDYSIPLALWNRGLLQTTGLEEWGLRLPVLLGGILLVPAVACWVWRRFGAFEGAVVAWLLALSPPLLLYSRFARPYGLVALLTFASLASWLAWQERRTWRLGLGSACAGAAAIFLNLVAAPALLAVWGYGGLVALRERSRTGSAGTLWRWAGWVALGLGLTGLLLWPGVESWQAFIERKAQGPRPSLDSWWGCLQVLFGSRHAAAVLAAAALAGVGAHVAARRLPRFAAPVGLALLAQTAALYAVAPDGADQPITLARYLLGAFLGVLVFAGLGLARLARAAGALRGAVAAAGLAAGLAAGPSAALPWRPDAYTSHRFHYAPAEWQILPERVPAWYREAGRHGRGGTITEAPWTLEWDRTVYGEYQRLHGRPVDTLTTVLAFADERVRLRTVIPLRRVQGDFAGLETLVVHRDVVAEWYHVSDQGDPQAFERWTTSLHRDDAARILEACRASPALELVYEDEWISVFERRRGSAP